MAGEWDTVDLGDVAAVRSGYAFKSSDWKDAGIPVVKIANVKSGRLEMSGCSFVTEATAARSCDSQLTTGDILIAMTGYIGDVARVRKTDLPCVLNQRVGKFSVRDANRLDADFLYTFLSWAETRQTIEALGYGSAQPNESPSLIHKVELPLPPLPIQKRIAHILGTLDDKIELNRRMNGTLEAMARALFRSWFVDFDPVHVLAGNKPEKPPFLSAEALAKAGFPDSFQDSPLGPIPMGWVETNVGSETDFQTGFAFKSKQFSENPPGIRLARGMNVKEGEFFWGSQARFWPKITPDIAGYQLQAGDVLIGMDGSKVGKNWVRVRTSDLPCLLVQRVARLRPASSIGENFIWILVGSPTFRSYVDGVKTGTSIPHISGGQIKSFAFIRPPRKDNHLFEEFESLVAPLTAQADENQAEIRTLSALRDTLLPKLLSGELSVTAEEAEAAAGTPISIQG